MDTGLIEYKTKQGRKRYGKIIDGKQYLICTKCGQLKELSTDNFYKHANGFMGFCSYCKECRTKLYESDKDLMRERKHKTYVKNIKKRKEYTKEYNKRQYVKDNHYKNLDIHIHGIRIKTQKYIKKLGIRPTICPICGTEGLIQAHHINYDNRNKIVFCCQTCHSHIHKGIIKCPQPIDLLLMNKQNDN